MPDITGPAIKLREMIKVVIGDEKFTLQEREGIMVLAAEDGVVDA